MSALERAIALFPDGAAGLAAAVGVGPMAVSQWKKRGVPPRRCRDIEVATGGKVTRAELDAELFGKVAANGAAAPLHVANA